MASDHVHDLAIIGGGVNGCGIARDAAGRGLSVVICEQNDLGGATSSASTKLFHGGLRYLEYYEFRLVRESLQEREVLLRAMPHISWPMRFVLPHHKGLRPAWLLRLGLFIYDNLGGRKILPATKTLNLRTDPTGKPLKDSFTKGFEYSDCWVEDSRLVMLNARDAAAKGAEVLTRTSCVTAERRDGLWCLTLEDRETGETREIRARGLVNAGGPWVEEVLRQKVRMNTSDRIRLVRGSHIVVPRIQEHDRSYIFQNADGRIIFAIPYETDYTLIGTTDREHEAAPGEVRCTDEERDYLCSAASEYFAKPLRPEDVVWTYAGVRPLYDDGAKSATAATRDYVLTVLEEEGRAPLLNVFGGKITTYRRLAEAAMKKLAPFYPQMGGTWTAGAPLPGGNFPHDGAERLAAELRERHPFLDARWAQRLVRAYGTEAREVLGEARTAEDLGEEFGATLTEAELRWMAEKEWVRTAADAVWRRTRLGLRLSADQIARIDAWLAAHRAGSAGRTEAAAGESA